AIQDAAITPNILVADANQDAVLPDEDGNALPRDEEKKIEKQQEDEQLNKAIDVLRSRQARTRFCHFEQSSFRHIPATVSEERAGAKTRADTIAADAVQSTNGLITIRRF